MQATNTCHMPRKSPFQVTIRAMTEQHPQPQASHTALAEEAGGDVPWAAPTPLRPLDATVTVPGSKSLSNRYLILAALSSQTVTIRGLLRSRDTSLMIQALEQLGVDIEGESSSSTTVRITPPRETRRVEGVPRFRGNVTIFCGLAGTVMRFLPALALFADGTVRFDGDPQAYERPMKPILDGLEQLGATVQYHGRTGFLPFSVTPPEVIAHDEVSIDSSASSQFISGLLLAASSLPRGLRLHHTASALPSLPHINMTVADIAKAGGHVAVDESAHVWKVEHHALQLPRSVTVEPDLSNAAPFLGAALLAQGSVRIPFWPKATTQPGGLLPSILERIGGSVDFPEEGGVRFCRVRSDGTIHGLGDFDLEAAGELAPSIAALLTFADSETAMMGIAHLRGHETNRLAAMVREIRRVGGRAVETEDGVVIRPVEASRLHGETIRSYHDHRMATFGAMLGLRIGGIQVENIETTGKTLPDFVAMWRNMLSYGHENTKSE